MHLDGVVADNAIWHCRQRRLAAKFLVRHALWGSRAPLHSQTGCVMAGVIVRTWNSERPLAFAHVVLTNILGVRRAREVQARITRRMDLW